MINLMTNVYNPNEDVELCTTKKCFVILQSIINPTVVKLTEYNDYVEYLYNTLLKDITWGCIGLILEDELKDFDIVFHVSEESYERFLNVRADEMEIENDTRVININLSLVPQLSMGNRGVKVINLPKEWKIPNNEINRHINNVYVVEHVEYKKIVKKSKNKKTNK